MQQRCLSLLLLLFSLITSSVMAQTKSVPPLQEIAALCDQAGRFNQSNNIGKAVPLLEKALTISEKTMGMEHPCTAAIAGDLSNVYESIGNYEMALAFQERALRIREKVRGINHPDTARSFKDLAKIYENIGQYEKASILYEKALVIREKTLGPEHPLTINCNTSLARVYLCMGNSEKAIELDKRTLEIRNKVLGPLNPKTGESMANIAEDYYKSGDYAKALPLYEKSLEINERNLGLEHLDVASSLNNLGCVYDELGDYSKALICHTRALNIREKALGSKHPEYARSLGNLAHTYLLSSDISKATALSEKALEIKETILGSEHIDTAKEVHSLANNYAVMGDYEKAIPLYQRNLAICEKKLGSENSETGIAAFSLAQCYTALGEYNKALELYQKGMAVAIAAHQRDDEATGLRGIAETFYLIGDSNNAASSASHWVSCQESLLQGVLMLGEAQRLGWSSRKLSFELPALILKPEQTDEVVLRWKGVVLDSLIEDRKWALTFGSTTDGRAKLDQIQSLKGQISKLMIGGGKDGAELILKLRQQIDGLESSLAKNGDYKVRFRNSSQVSLDPLRALLVKGDTILEFISYKNIKTKKHCFGVSIVSPDSNERFVCIEDVREINDALLASRQSIARGDEKALAEQLKTLSEKLWSPIAKNLPEGTKRLFIGPDGQLNFLSFATLPAQDGSFLAEHYDIAYVGSGRDLTRKLSPSNSKTVVLFADPVFDRQASGFSSNALALRSGELDAFGKIVLLPLPGTRAEESIVEDAAKGAGWSPEVHLGEAASKSAIMDLKSPGILHLATHGFYLNTLSSNGADGERGMKVMESADSTKPAPPPKIDPMHASGIALTGAQATLKAWSEGRVPNSKEDGILTAEEVAGLDLDGTWLVTLSACETGVGEAKSGEGVFGLRRAFMIAGAQNLLMTLWPVSDEVTPKIMADFYKEALATHDAAGSLAKVQRDWLLKLRKEKGLLAAVRDAGPFAMVVMAKQDSTFSSPSTAVPMTAPQAPAPAQTNSSLPTTSPAAVPASTSTNQLLTTNAPATPEASPSPSAAPALTPTPSSPAPEAPMPASTPAASPSPSSTPDLSNLPDLKKAA